MTENTRTADPLTDPFEELPAIPTTTAITAKAGHDEPARPATTPIEDAFGYAVDRIDRLEHVLGNLNGVVMRAGVDLEAILTGGEYAEPETYPQPSEDATTPDDRRSTIAKRVTRLGNRADNLATATDYITRRLEAILDAVEL